MGVKRIVGHTVRVTEQDSPIGKIYGIRGDGVSGLHQYCEQLMIKVSPLIEDSFYITHETIQEERAFPEIAKLHVCNAIVEAAQKLAVGHP